MELQWRWRVGLGAAGVLVVGAIGGALLVQGLGDEHVAPMPSVEAEESAGTAIVVDVQGAVAEPGVYVLAPGARVLDAIARAGGTTDDADTTSLNLAQELVDGTQVVVPVAGAEPAPGTTTDGLVNVNTADATTLETLPRVGPALAAAIIAHRDEHGPFAQVADLELVSGIGPAVLAQLEPLVTV